MGKQFITTQAPGGAHKSDVLGIALTQKHTFSVSSDGYLKAWANNINETANPMENVQAYFVDALGLHHVAVYENIIQGETICLVAVVAFSGQCYFYKSTGGTFSPVDLLGKSGNFWAPYFFKDPHGKQDVFGLTCSNGATNLYHLVIETPEITHGSASAIVLSTVSLDQYGTILAGIPPSFPTCLAITSDLVAVGYQSGLVTMNSSDTLKPIYSFTAPSQASTVRSLKFQPSFEHESKVLAVARDATSAGTITLYDTKYGEIVGTLTQPTHSTSLTIAAVAHDGWIFEIDFNEDGSFLASGGFDAKVRVWNMESREREATLVLSPSDLDYTEAIEADESDRSAVSCVKFIGKGVRGGILGGDSNEGLVAGSFDKGIRWFREAGGV
ncbi:hypothetical protein BABINDRAFT_162052 [Babjeviella inositovora NRRL Y-12698]|uniref:Anaphase-promoting complex subunit 4-like WD40 domain-containing protein n=1 Tax=Babjeviella inositovora NRRL Y-12698 TaxID=984486 RepID=A0A1E3QPR9_9ASCO|nr:uncharacterized protein BABINDRAFT_162052 [Babjeviella inositovora NRRL Y-12698]ODQ78967.1 hypothetical protein BABINDRAFT_162052 [Babjeviella inositovora NRRL Y-12698]